MKRVIRKSLVIHAVILPVLVHGYLFGQMSESNFRRLIDAEKWSADELAALDRAESVVRTLPTADKQELASLGVIRIKGLPPVSTETFRESLSQKSSGTVQAGGRFSNPATVEDLNDLELDKNSIEQLRKCTVGDCDLNLSADFITRFRLSPDLNSANSGQKATLFIREMLVRLVNDYWASGNKALGTYDNRRKKVDLPASHRALLASVSLINELAPEFALYLDQFPGKDLADVENSMHWSVVDFGLKPSITVSHAAAYPNKRGDFEELIIVSKQIYSSRYLDSSLTMTALIRVSGPEGIDSYIIFADRSRSDALEGPLGGFARKAVQKESVKRIASLLDRAHSRLLALSKPAANPGPADLEASLSEKLWSFVRSRLGLATAVALMVALLIVILSRRRTRAADTAGVTHESPGDSDS